MITATQSERHQQWLPLILCSSLYQVDFWTISHLIPKRQDCMIILFTKKWNPNKPANYPACHLISINSRLWSLAQSYKYHHQEPSVDRGGESNHWSDHMNRTHVNTFNGVILGWKQYANRHLRWKENNSPHSTETSPRYLIVRKGQVSVLGHNRSAM